MVAILIRNKIFSAMAYCKGIDDGELGLTTLVGLVIYVIYFLRDPQRRWVDVKSALWLLV